MLQKCSKNPKFRFFGHIGCSMTIRIMKFGMNKHVPHMNSHAKFQKLGFNSFGEIWFCIFSKMCNYGLFDIYQYEFKNRLANFSKMNLLIHMKCTNIIPKFQEGTITQKARKTFQSWQKSANWHCYSFVLFSNNELTILWFF